MRAILACLAFGLILAGLAPAAAPETIPSDPGLIRTERPRLLIRPHPDPAGGLPGTAALPSAG